LSASRRDEKWSLLLSSRLCCHKESLPRSIWSFPTQGIKHANCSRKLEVRRTSLQCRGLVVRPPGILAMNAWVAHGTEVIDRITTKLLEATLIGENYQKTPMEVPSCRQHIASSQEMGKTSAWRCLSRQSKPWTTPSYSIITRYKDKESPV